MCRRSLPRAAAQPGWPSGLPTGFGAAPEALRWRTLSACDRRLCDAPRGRFTRCVLSGRADGRTLTRAVITLDDGAGHVSYPPAAHPKQARRDCYLASADIRVRIGHDRAMGGDGGLSAAEERLVSRF